MSEESEAIDRLNDTLSAVVTAQNVILLHSDSQYAFMVVSMQAFNLKFDAFMLNYLAKIVSSLDNIDSSFNKLLTDYLAKIIDNLEDISKNLDILAKTDIQIETSTSYRNAIFELKAVTTTEP